MATKAATRIPVGIGEPEDVSAATSALEPLRRKQEQASAEEALLQTGVTAADAEVARAEGEQQKALKEAAATSAQQYAEESQKLVSEAEKKKELNPFPTFKPTQEDLMSYSQLGSLIMTAGLLMGGGAKSSAKVALASMTGMLNGWRQGRKDLWEREAKQFEKDLQRVKSEHESILKDLQLGLQLAATNREASRAKLEAAAYKSGPGSVIAAKIARGQALDALKIAQGANKNIIEIEKMKLDLAAKNRAAGEQAEQARLQREATMAAAATKTGRGATQQQFIVQRAVNALGGVQSALETIIQLPQGATTGWIPNLQTKDGMFNAVRNQLGRKISSVDAEFMNTLLSGIGRNLASIEASGTATGLTQLAGQLQSGVYINAGVDDPFKVAMKLADIRRIATENIRPAINSGLMVPQQAEEANRLIDKIEKTIPYSTLDVANAYRQAKAGSKPTIQQSTIAKIKPETSVYSDPEKEARYQQWLKENHK